MFRINPIARTTYRLLSSLPRYNFCINHGTLDPSKHITMNHNPNNMYTDAIDIGVYQKHPNTNSIAPRTYEPKVLQIVASALNKRYGSSITADQLDKSRSKSWTRIFKRHAKSQDEFSQVLGNILNQLAFNVIVRQSRWTWVIEQKYRLQYSHKAMENSQFETVEDFLQQYNTVIEDLVLFSNLGHSKLLQAPSALEKHLDEQMLNKPTGVLDLEAKTPQNKNLINSFLRFLHS